MSSAELILRQSDADARSLDLRTNIALGLTLTCMAPRDGWGEDASTTSDLD